MKTDAKQLWLNGTLTPGLASPKPIHNPATGDLLSTVHQASRDQVLEAITGMTSASPALRRRSSYQRFLSCRSLPHPTPRPLRRIRPHHLP